MNLLKKLSPLVAVSLFVGNFALANTSSNVALEDLALVEENVAPLAVVADANDHFGGHHHGGHHHGGHQHGGHHHGGHHHGGHQHGGHQHGGHQHGGHQHGGHQHGGHQHGGHSHFSSFGASQGELPSPTIALLK